MNWQSFILSVLFVMTACEKIIDYPVSPGELNVVVNSILNTDSTISVNISKSVGILDTSSAPYIHNASVNLYENNEPAGSMKYQGNGFYALDGFVPEAGIEYAVAVNAPGKDNIRASCMIPEPVPIISADTILRLIDNDVYYKSYTYDVILTVRDPPGLSNFYEIILFQKTLYTYPDTVYSIYSRRFCTDDPVFEYYRINNDVYPLALNLDTEMLNASAVYFSDKLLDGKKFTVKFSLEQWNINGMYYIYLRSLTKDYYLYLASLAYYNQASGNPFSERVQLHSNISNGLGIFGGYSSAADSFYVGMQ